MSTSAQSSTKKSSKKTTEKTTKKTSPKKIIPEKPKYFLRIADNMSGSHDMPVHNLVSLFGSKPRNISNSVQRFYARNKSLMDFLGIESNLTSSGNNLYFSYRSSNYVGAIPTFLPDGSQGGDLQVYPHLGNGTAEDGMVQLTELLRLLDQSVTPEFTNSLPLRNQLEMQPPIFYEAIKYLDLYQKAISQHWRKFITEKRVYPHPKSSTDWNKYAIQYANPQKRLSFPAKDNVLSENHPEWQQLKYVFQIAAQELNNFKTPPMIRIRYHNLIQELTQKTRDIPAIKTNHIPIRSADPVQIKALKTQAEIILSRQKIACTAWRIDVAEVFERYVQYVLEHAAVRCATPYTCISNQKFTSITSPPGWGLKYLEPDILLANQDNLIIADAKYKANMYALNQTRNAILKETHRHDLHQILAYCSFAPQPNKLALLCYPASQFIIKELIYQGKPFYLKNRVLLVGLPFNADETENNIQTMKSKVLDIYLPKAVEKS